MIVKVLTSCRDRDDWFSSMPTQALDEAIRRVRVHDQLRAMFTEHGGNKPGWMTRKALAILDSDGEAKP
jgi:hypothetical protein